MENGVVGKAVGNAAEGAGGVDGGMVEVARFENAGDLRAMLVGERADGALVLEEDLKGPSVVVAYECEHVLLRVTTRGMARADLEEFARDEANDILDLMDILDERGVSYEFTSEILDNVIMFRPMPAEPE